MRESPIENPCEIHARLESKECEVAGNSPSESLSVEQNKHELSEEQRQFAEVLGQSLAEMWRQESEAHSHFPGVEAQSGTISQAS
jgi:hypothetical protein